MVSKQVFKVAVDSGNHSIKTIINGEPVREIRAIKAQINPGVGLLRRTAESPCIVKKGRIVHLGSNAQRYPLVTPQVLSDKLDPSNVLDAVLACLGPIQGSNEYTCHVAYSVPDTGRMIGKVSAVNHIKSLLTGTHKYTWNAEQMVVTIEAVEVVREADAAYRTATKAGLVAQDGDTLLVDWGGGTVNATLFYPEGDVVDALTLDHYGCVKLATMVAENKVIRSAVGAPELHIIMDGIANGTYQYGRTQVNFKSALDQVIPQWYELVKSNIVTQLNSKMDYVGAMIHNGGSSLLLKDLIKGKDGVYLTPEPKYSVVKGLLSYV